MTKLIFEDRGWTVVTSAWTVASKKDSGRTELIYLWGPDGVSFFESATGTARRTVDLRGIGMLKDG